MIAPSDDMTDKHEVPRTMGQQFGRRSWAEPWKIKMVEPLNMTDRPTRERALIEAGYNTFPPALAGRLHRPAHRQRHERDERPPMGGDDEG